VLADEIGRPRKRHPILLLAGLDGERDRQVGLPGADGPARIRFSGVVIQAPGAACR
jgi:hypothetical protein